MCGRGVPKGVSKSVSEGVLEGTLEGGRTEMRVRVNYLGQKTQQSTVEIPCYCVCM